MQQRPDAEQVAGYNNWKTLGRTVKKGEKGIKIIAPHTNKIVQQPQSPPPLSQDPTEEPSAPLETYRISGYRLVTVFDISQTEGEPLPKVTKLLEGDDVGVLQHLARIAQEYDIRVVYTSLLGKTNGEYSQVDNTITLNSDRDSVMQAKTLAHELAHSILHRKEALYTSDSRMRAICELEAESVASMTLANFGINTGEYSFGYIAECMTGYDIADKLQVETIKTHLATLSDRIFDVGTVIADVNLQLRPQGYRPISEIYRDRYKDGPEINQIDK
jgi:antirestriction protein ArdC